MMKSYVLKLKSVNVKCWSLKKNRVKKTVTVKKNQHLIYSYTGRVRKSVIKLHRGTGTEHLKISYIITAYIINLCNIKHHLNFIILICTKICGFLCTLCTCVCAALHRNHGSAEVYAWSVLQDHGIRLKRRQTRVRNIFTLTLPHHRAQR